MIESKSWDGIKRIETLFIDYLGAEDESSTLNWTNSMRIDIVNLRK
jgi:predicted P-loop ATPase